MKKALLVLACFFASLTLAFAQKTVRGTVSDTAGEPVVGAYVMVSGSASLGAITDATGAFSIANVPNSAESLVVSCIGYSTKTVAIGNGPVAIVLEEDNEYLDEVVVTAQGLTRKEKAIGYSVQSINSEQLTSTHSSALGNSLAGKVAGAQFWGSGGSTFDEGRIVLRGPTSYSNVEGSQPIYVVDGTIMSNANAVNMDDVASINILKGPSATALYGSRGANGAVVITTKRAEEGQSHIDFSHTTSVQTYYNHINFQKLYGGGSYGRGLERVAAENGDSIDYLSAAYLMDDLGDGTYAMDYYSDENWGARYDGTTLVRSALSWDPTSPYYGQATPWEYQLNLRDLTRNAWTNTTNIAFSKATKGLSTRVAFTNVEQQGVFYNSNAVRRSFSITSTAKPTSWLTADFSYRYRYRKNHNPSSEGYSANGNYLCDFVQWGQTNVNLAQLRDWQRPDGSWRNWNIISTDDISANFHDNPFAVMENYNNDDATNYHLIAGDIYASLPLNIRLGVRVNSSITNQLREYRYGTGSINFDSYFRTYQTNVSDFTAQAYATWSDSFVDGKLTAEAAAFAENRTYDYYYLTSNTNGGLSVKDFYNLAGSSSTYSTSNTERHFETRSFFGTATLGWDDFVYLDGSIRYDIDSRLAPDNNAFLYGGGSLSVMLSKFINAPWLNFWKIRGSVAQVGSTIDVYNIYPTYNVNTKFHGQPALREPTSQVNPNILPTISTSYELGTEFKLFGNRLFGDFNIYRKNTRNDIINATVLPQSGYSSRKMNAGLVRNQGIELQLGGTPVKTSNFEWTLSGNIAKNVNTLIELSDDQHETTIYDNRFYYSWRQKSVEGYPIGVIETASRWARTEDGKLILTDGNANVGEVRPTWDISNKIAGNTQPDLTGGFNTSFRFKQFTLNASLDFMIGGQFVSWTNMWGQGSGLLAETAAVNDRGKNIREPIAVGGGIFVEGVDADGNPKSGYMNAAYYFQYKYQYDNDSWVYDRSYVKLREVSLRYDLPQKFIQNLGIGLSRASVAFVATNPWLIWAAAPNLDPSELGGAEYNMLEGGQAISTRSFGLTVNVTF